MASSSSIALSFLRRLLCARGAAGDDLSAPEPEGRSPCVVARLMGLDAMPAAEAHPRQLLRRGRGDAAPSGEKPPPAAYLRAENDKFLLLSFSPEEREDRPGGAARQRRARRPRKLQFVGGDAQSSSPVSVLQQARHVHEESSTTTTTTASSSLEDAEPCSATSEESHFASSEQQHTSTTKPHSCLVVQLDATYTPVRPTTTTVLVHHASRRSERDTRTTATEPGAPGTTTTTGCCRQPVRRLDEKQHLEHTERGALTTTTLRERDGADVEVLAAEMGAEILDQLVREAAVELVQISLKL